MLDKVDYFSHRPFYKKIGEDSSIEKNDDNGLGEWVRVKIYNDSVEYTHSDYEDKQEDLLIIRIFLVILIKSFSLLQSCLN